MAKNYPSTQTLKRLVKDVLQERNHSVDESEIAYVNPKLEQPVGESGEVVLYYKKPNQTVVSKHETTTSNDESQHSKTIEEVFLLNTLDADGNLSSEEIDRQLLARQTAPLLTPELKLQHPPTGSLAPHLANSSAGHSWVPNLNDQQKTWLSAAGIPENDWLFVDFIVSKESNWRPFVYNGGGAAKSPYGSSAYGLCQTMLSVHSNPSRTKYPIVGIQDFMKNPVAQLQWCHNYALGKYGSWHNAYHRWQAMRLW